MEYKIGAFFTNGGFNQGNVAFRMTSFGNVWTIKTKTGIVCLEMLENEAIPGLKIK